jgi:SSS family transporter
MLLLFIALYLLLTIGIGLFAASKVKSSKDYLVAGRSLPLYMNIATVFATWLGAETVLSVSATFAATNLGGIAGDPFGAAACLLLAAFVFARLFYRMNLLTIGDFYKHRYGKKVEVLTSLAIAISYIGWTAAQLTALGLVIDTLSGDLLNLSQSIALGTVIVLVYTIFGGMWSVAFTDLFQTVIIIVGLSILAFIVGERAGGFDAVLQQAAADGKFTFLPSSTIEMWEMLGVIFAFVFGAIPQQDVFQRMTSAKDEKTAVWGTAIGGVSYLLFAFVPIFIAYAALVAYPELGSLFNHEDGRVIQQILPNLVLGNMPVWVQVMFFGALLSAILSTASGALLAPTAIVTENIVRPFAHKMQDKTFLKVLRGTLVGFTGIAFTVALNSEKTMYEMVAETTSVTLVAAFVPLVAGAFWKRATTQGALLAILAGLGTWLGINPFLGIFGIENIIPTNILGMLASIAGMISGSLLPQFIGKDGHSVEDIIRKTTPGEYDEDSASTK